MSGAVGIWEDCDGAHCRGDFGSDEGERWTENERKRKKEKRGIKEKTCRIEPPSGEPELVIKMK